MTGMAFTQAAVLEQYCDGNAGLSRMREISELLGADSG